MFPEAKVTSKFLNSLVWDIEFSRNWVGYFLHKGLLGLSIANDGEFSFHWINFQSDTIRPFLNADLLLFIFFDEQSSLKY